MQFRTSITLLFTFIFSSFLFAQQVKEIQAEVLDTSNIEIIDLDDLLEKKQVLASPSGTVLTTPTTTTKNSTDSVMLDVLSLSKKSNAEIVSIDTVLLQANPLFIDLVYRTEPILIDANTILERGFQIQIQQDTLLHQRFFSQKQTTEQIIKNLRQEAYKYISYTAPQLFVYDYNELPDTDELKQRLIEGKKIEKVKFSDSDTWNNRMEPKLRVKEMKFSNWTKKAVGQAQFSQNYVSPNWHQGGSEYVAILGILSGKINYDNKKNIQWDNNGEWRMGFNSVGDENAVRDLNTNDDIIKINSKFGLKAGGNFYYSGNMDFSTQLFQNYKSATSTVLKSSFLTPLRFNFGIGMDYKYKKLFSLMVSPISYKYIYLLNTENIKPKSFGIEDGGHVLKQIGSQFIGQTSFSPSREIQIDSKLSFYTNYKAVEFDWEIVGNFTINRFLSTRISINPRFDNTIILEEGEVPNYFQFKELLSFGFSYNFLK